MQKGTAVIAILIAFVGGLTVGHITGSGSGVEGEEIAAEGGAGSAGGAADAAGPERYRVPVTAAQPSRGPADALVTIVQFSDFQCPFCSRVEPTMTQLIQEYGNKIRVVWRNNPLPFHQNAGPAAQAAAEAFKQGGSAKFWRMHELMFQNQQALTRPDLERYAQQAGLDMAAFRAALDGNTHQAEIAADQALATSLGARGTPYFFINGRQVQGAQPITAFKEIIDDEVQRAERLVRTGVARNRVYAELTAHGLTAPAAAPGGAPNAPPAAPRAQPDPNAVYNVPVGTSPARGRADALVTIVMFSDFQCPFCSRVEPTLNTLRERYGNDLRIVWKNNPLPFHQNAGPAAELAMAANAQGKFWEAHDLLFENQQHLERADLERYATQLGLNLAAVRTAIDTNQYQASITADQQLATRLGARGTPAFFINGRNLSGAQPLENFTRLVDEELAKARAKVTAGTPRNRVYEETIRNGATTAQTIAAPAAAAPAAQPGAPNPDQVYNMPIPPNAPRKGGAHARVVIQQISDYQCPFCSRVEPTVDRIVQEYGDRVAIVWRDFPLPFHQNAMPAAEAAREVLAQGGVAKFWQYHGLLFQNQQSLDRAGLERFAEQVGGINMARFRTALDSHTHQAAIQADVTAATSALGQVGTPTFLINGRMISGAQPFENFKAAIDRALAEPAH